MVFVSLLPAYIGLVTFWVICSIKRNHGKQTEPGQEALLHVFFAYILLIIGLTLSPLYLNVLNPARNINLVPVVESLKMWQGARLSVSLYNLVGNFIVLIPFGFLLSRIYPAWRKAGVIMLASLGFSLLIECAQYATATRVFDVDDIILNTLGGVFGYFCFRLFHRIHPFKAIGAKKKQRPSMGVVIAGAMVFLALMGMSAYRSLQAAEVSLFEATQVFGKQSRVSTLSLQAGGDAYFLHNSE